MEKGRYAVVQSERHSADGQQTEILTAMMKPTLLVDFAKQLVQAHCCSRERLSWPGKVAGRGLTTSFVPRANLDSLRPGFQRRVQQRLHHDFLVVPDGREAERERRKASWRSSAM